MKEPFSPGFHLFFTCFSPTLMMPVELEFSGCLVSSKAKQAETDRVSRMQHDPMMGRKNVSGRSRGRSCGLSEVLLWGFVKDDFDTKFSSTFTFLKEGGKQKNAMYPHLLQLTARSKAPAAELVFTSALSGQPFNIVNHCAALGMTTSF